MGDSLTIIYADDWQGLFYNGELVDEYHTLNQGNTMLSYLKKISKEYFVDIKNIQEGHVTPEYQLRLEEELGGFHKNLADVDYTRG